MVNDSPTNGPTVTAPVAGAAAVVAAVAVAVAAASAAAVARVALLGGMARKKKGNVWTIFFFSSTNWARGKLSTTFQAVHER